MLAATTACLRVHRARAWRATAQLAGNPTVMRLHSKAARTVGVTGSSGIIGSRVCNALVEDGWDVVGFANSKIMSQGGPGVESASETHPHLIDVDCDLSSPDCLNQNLFDGCSHVLHLAGLGSPEADFEDILEHNIRATYHVLEAARRSTSVKRVVLASTNHVQHGLTISDPTNYVSIDFAQTTAEKMGTSDDPFPDSFYGASKLHNEAMGKLYSRVRRHFEVVSLRIGWVLFDDPTVLTPEEGGNYLQSQSSPFGRPACRKQRLRLRLRDQQQLQEHLRLGLHGGHAWVRATRQRRRLRRLS